MSRLFRRLVTPVGLTLLAALSCNDIPTVATPVPDPVPNGRRVLGVIEMRISVTGGGEVRASVVPADPVLSMDGPRFALSQISNGGVNSVLIESLPGAGSFTYGAPGAGGYRYVFASARVQNAGFTSGGDTVAHTTPRSNVTAIATAVPSGGGFSGVPGTPFADLAKYDGSPADPAIASGILPTGAVRQTLLGGITTYSADILQVFTEAEVAVLSPPYDPFPYGFIVQHATATNTRTLAANPGPTQWDGIVTLGIKIPLQANPADDVYGFSMFFVVVDDSETRVTQSLEEQLDATGQAAFEAKVAAFAGGPDGVSGITLLPGGSYGGSVAAPVRRLCAVRVAGTAGSPTAFLDGSAAGSCPTLSGVSPNSAAPNTTTSVTLTGTNFVAGAGNTTVAVSGSGVTVNNVVVNSATSLTADFVITSGAATGPRTVTVTTATGNSGTLTFTVLAPPPTLTGINPTSGVRLQTVPVTLTGTNFVSGATVAVAGGGVTVMNVNVQNSTTITALFQIAETATLGARNVTVTTGSGTSGAQTFTVLQPSGNAGFNYNGTNGTDGSPQNFTVPAGVTSITVEAWGAAGGQGTFAPGAGGSGGKVTATISVTPGEVLSVFVGGRGRAGDDGGAAGFNGGAAGGATLSRGGGGGGASDVRRGPTRLVIAGGGGGGGGFFGSAGGAGGAGGGLTADAGTAAAVAGSPQGGGAGTQSGGGGGGSGSSTIPAGPNGTDGASNSGGAGASGDASGGGGGGGYFGGGGGGGGSGLNVGTERPGAGGGGGSSFTVVGATNVSHQKGVQGGNGLVVITW